MLGEPGACRHNSLPYHNPNAEKRPIGLCRPIGLKKPHFVFGVALGSFSRSKYVYLDPLGKNHSLA